MSGEREWKPGDVALLLGVHQLGQEPTWCRAIRTDQKRWRTILGTTPADIKDIRPLVVLNPDDPDALGRLLAAYMAAKDAARAISRESVDCLRVALREFANPTPPKPDEPLGLGAVVESERGRKYVRAGDGWLPETVMGQFRNPIAWDDIAAIHVLSPGYTEDGAS